MRPVIRRGDRGRHVEVWQEHLLKQNCDPSVALEKPLFGFVTEMATAEYQKANRLLPDGIVGPRTWITAGLAEAAPTAAWTEASPQASSGGATCPTCKAEAGKPCTAMWFDGETLPHATRAEAESKVVATVRTWTKMPKLSFLPFQSDLEIGPATRASFTTDAQIPFKPYGLVLHCAGEIGVLELAIGNYTSFVSYGEIPSSVFLAAHEWFDKLENASEDDAAELIRLRLLTQQMDLETMVPGTRARLLLNNPTNRVQPVKAVLIGQCIPR